jgi:hypothetical protein
MAGAGRDPACPGPAARCAAGGWEAGARAAGCDRALDGPGRAVIRAGDAGPDRPDHRDPGPPAGPGGDADPAVQWRVIVTNSAGQAIAASRIRRRARDRPGAARDGPGPDREGTLPGAGLVGRVTLTISQDVITASQRAPCGPGPPGPAGGIAAAALETAARALAWALAQAKADEAANGCAHQGESRAYRPPPRLREYVTARDVTCRFPPCRQPAWRADLDHTLAWDKGGRTCGCNLGGLWVHFQAGSLDLLPSSRVP